MAKPKKDGERISVYFERSILNRLRDYSDKKGQTMTLAMERIIEDFLDEYDEKSKENQ